jgi:hypothetical protein
VKPFQSAELFDSEALNPSGSLALSRSLSGSKTGEFGREADGSRGGQRLSLFGRPIRSSPAPPLTLRRAAPGEKVLSGSPGPTSTTVLNQNDLVVFASHAGIWRVVAPVNRSKADIRMNEGFDTRIVTAPLECVSLVRRAGSPGYRY